MKLATWLTKAKSSQLKHVAFLTGRLSTGTKAELLQTLQQQIDFPSTLTTNEHGSRSKGSDAGSSKSCRRILSIDMGIRNLAVCLLEVPCQALSLSGKDPTRYPTILAWEKVDVLSLLTRHHEKPLSLAQERKSKTSACPEQETSVSKTHNLAQKQSAKCKKRDATPTKPSLPADCFSPRNLSLTALDLTRHLLRVYQPNEILIERQRFRSGGASAVQEWTLRVNMLESMLWSCLATMRSHEDSVSVGPGVPGRLPVNSATHEVNPARVAKFWCSGLKGEQLKLSPSFYGDNGFDQLPTVLSGKIEKKDKIAIVKSWLQDQSSQGIKLKFAANAEKIASIFRAETIKKKVKRGSGVGDADQVEVENFGKLDDLADCLLQGMAWVRWMENRSALAKAASSVDQ